MTQSEAIQRYTGGDKEYEQKLNSYGQMIVMCKCGEDGCDGWAMVGIDNLQDHLNLYLTK